LTQVISSIAMLLSLVLVSCASISHSEGIQGADLSEVQLYAKRATIERTLGEPVEIRNVNDLTMATYAYDRERPAQNLDAGGVIAEILFLQWQPIIWAVEAGSREKEKSRLTITYGRDDTVVKLDPALVEARERFLRAACGDASSQYIAGYEQEHGLGVSPNLVNAYVWYSIAATSGRPEAAVQRDQIAKKMKPEQLTAAERLVEAWTPPDCSEWRRGDQ
jgi:TPR repeat protein